MVLETFRQVLASNTRVSSRQRTKRGIARLVAGVLVTLGATGAIAADEALQHAIKCADFDDCVGAMLEATVPRKPEAINVAAARIGEMPKPVTGDRKSAKCDGWFSSPHV